jgi:hypothetical protein
MANPHPGRRKNRRLISIVLVVLIKKKEPTSSFPARIWMKNNHYHHRDSGTRCHLALHRPGTCVVRGNRVPRDRIHLRNLIFVVYDFTANMIEQSRIHAYGIRC